MSKKPPRHTVRPMMHIIDLDAFDNDRVLEDLEPIGDDDVDLKAAHPVLMYRNGETRFDVEATGTVYIEDGSGDLKAEERTAREYLKSETNAVFECQRLPTSEVATCLSRGDHVGAIWAFHLACKDISGADFEYHVPRRSAATVSQVQHAHDNLGYDVVERIGRMIIEGSKAKLTSAEGKRSGSSRGAQ